MDTVYRPDPAAARAARTLAKQRRWAREMRDAGWFVVEPDSCDLKEHVELQGKLDEAFLARFD